MWVRWESDGREEEDRESSVEKKVGATTLTALVEGSDIVIAPSASL
jgi:hypothetical protein